MPFRDRLPQAHSFVRPVQLAAVRGPSTPLIDTVLAGLQKAMLARGHQWTDEPGPDTDAFVTTAVLHEPVSWRRSTLFSGRKRFGLSHKPATYAFVQVREAEFARLYALLEAALSKPTPEPADYDFPGLSQNACQVLHDQGRRGGPMMSLGRLLQAQSKSLRTVMVIGDERPVAAHLYDLAGAYPRLEAADPERFYEELGLRIATQLSTREVTEHVVDPDVIPAAAWRDSPAPAAMTWVSRELGRRDFFTNMVCIADLVDVPALTGAVASQYSEGCFGTFDAALDAQVVTATGSDRPVEKACLSEDEIAVIRGVLSDGAGVHARQVEGRKNERPSSEAVEFELIDERLPRRVPPASFGVDRELPVIRSKLHGHRGVAGYDPATVEYVPLDEPYFHYLVSCSTEAQALGIAAAFARSESLRDPDDPRTVVFTVLPGHGMLAAEKWVAGEQPFRVLLRAMDERRMEISDHVPQGVVTYELQDGRMVLREGAGGDEIGGGDALSRDGTDG